VVNKAPESGIATLPDLPCEEGDDERICAIRNASYKAGAISGMTGGSLGFFALRGGQTKPSGPRPPANCFLAGTLILMADGSKKKIEDIQVGDEVLSTDPRSGETMARSVLNLIRTEGERELNSLSVETSQGIQDITATQDHPFWSPSEGRWVEAGEAREGMTLVSATGEHIRVTSNHSFKKTVKTFNFAVADLHTYYVLAGETPVLVHNSNCPTGKLSDDLPSGMNKKIAEAYDAVRLGEIPSHNVYGGKEHPWWAGAKEYRVPGRPETDRILVRTVQTKNGPVDVYGWTNTHYKKIQKFSAPHFPDSGW
jgi:hypothetical protein